MKEKKIVFSIIGITVFMGVLFIIFRKNIAIILYNSSNEILMRYGEILVGKVSSGDVRAVTNQINKQLLDGNYFLGRGIGQILTLYNPNGEAVTSGLFIDNGILTFTIKMGIVSLMFVLTIIISWIYTLIRWGKSIDKIFIIVGSFFSFSLMAVVINSQMIYSLPVSTVTVILTIIATKNKKRIK